MTSVVALGGGHGLSRSLRALSLLSVDSTAVVTVADDGGSSGRLRRDLGVLPPGDLRRALSATVPDTWVADVLEYRFGGTELRGHALGNLLLVALADLQGDLGRGLEVLRKLVGGRARVLPCTEHLVELAAEGESGTVRGQVAIATSSGHRRLRLVPEDAPGHPDAVAAVADADLIVLGPGSLFTSILPAILVPDIHEALRASTAPIVYVANLREQPGETEGLTQRQHIDVLTDHLDDRLLDAAIFHAGPRPHGPGRVLAPLDEHPHVGRCITADILDGDDGHDPSRLAAVLEELLPT